MGGREEVRKKRCLEYLVILESKNSAPKMIDVPKDTEAISKTRPVAQSGTIGASEENKQLKFNE